LTEKELEKVTGGDKTSPVVSDEVLVTKGTTKGTILGDYPGPIRTKT